MDIEIRFSKDRGERSDKKDFGRDRRFSRIRKDNFCKNKNPMKPIGFFLTKKKLGYYYINIVYELTSIINSLPK
jgi:hypothetical protein